MRPGLPCKSALTPWALLSPEGGGVTFHEDTASCHVCPLYRFGKRYQKTESRQPAHSRGPPVTWPDLVLSMEQSGMILDSCTIQLLILSRRRRSTVGQSGGRGDSVSAPRGPRPSPQALPLRHHGGPRSRRMVPTFVMLSPAFLIPSGAGSF